jgi:hypothetical protein
MISTWGHVRQILHLTFRKQNCRSERQRVDNINSFTMLIVEAGDPHMLSNCANPKCSAPFHYLHDGRLFEVQVTPQEMALTKAETGETVPKKRPSKVERFWLCSKCSATMTLAVNRENEALLLPLKRNARVAAAS